MAALVDSPAPASPDDSTTAASRDRRPSLSISTAHAAVPPPPRNDVPPEQPRSSPSAERPPSGGAGAGGGGVRSFSHARSQSMSEQHRHSSSPTSPPSAGGGEASGSGGGGGAQGGGGGSTGDLVRRHHTLSTSSSRMGRLERSRARLALQGVGLSEEDQDFYIPPSPVRSGPAGGWSDVGHGAPFSGAPPTRHSLAVVGEAHSRSTSTSSAWGGSSEAASSSSPSVGVAAGYSSPHDEQQDQQQPISTPVAAKRSSFVVLRGAKGDAALTQRRTEQPQQQQQQQPIVASPPRVDGFAQRTSSPPKELKHKNSLKPFLEAEAGSAGGEEEWERSLKDERDKEEMELRRGEEEQREAHSTDPLSSSYPSQGHSPFTHSRASTYQQAGSSVDPWHAGDDSQTASVRRHQSLNSFRPTATTSSESLSAASHDGGWGAHTRLASNEELLSSLSLGSVGFGRSRSGTTPAPLTLGNSHTTLSHSNSLNSHLPGHNHTSLHHSNSLGSHDRGALSPVGFPRSPWSPTYAETKQLGGISSVVGGTPPTGMGLSRGGSGSSRGSRISEEVSRMSEEMGQMELGVDGRPFVGKSPSPSGLDRENSVSPQPHLQGVGRSLSNNEPPTANRRLPPLMTNLDTLQQQQQHPQHPHLQQAQQPLNNSFLSRQGPASASAFVPPIGHSHLPSAASHLPASQAQPNYLPSIAEPNQHTARGNFTAVPGASSSDWHRQKEMLIGAGAGSAFPSAVGVNPTGEAWPAGGGFGVGIAIQQQQQIQVLQNQMQQALSAMEVMRNQGAQIPAGFTAPGLRGAPNGFGAAGAFGAGTGLSPPPPIAGTQPNGANAIDSPIDIPTLVANKGYNPAVFDLRPANARFFVIKSYTEEDVHKSLKYEIWASTDLGNKRLDRAFRESADKGPIYLFFSVNASGHFAGMAQMLTPVDYQTSSNVWASDKWKGVLKVRWIYIKDVPLASLRHIRLSNTPENKPVTSSRDTQEVPYDAGLEVLRILSSYQSRTSLLQDLPWYEAKLSQGGADKEDGEETPHPSHYARPTPSPQPGHQPHYAPRPPQSHSPAPYQLPPHHQQQQQLQQQQQQPYLAPQAQYGMPTGPMGMGVGAPHQSAPMHQQQQQPMQNAGGGGRRFFNRNGGGGGGPQVF